MDKIYIVTEEWMNEGEGGCTPHPFTTYEKAKAFYDKLIEKEKTEYMAANAFASDDVDETEDGTDDSKAYRVEVIDNEGGPNTWTFFDKGEYNDFHVLFTLCEYVVDYDYPELDK